MSFHYWRGWICWVTNSSV